MSEEGAVFQSYLDGQTILLSPELSIETQKAIGSDIMMALDQCIASTADRSDARGRHSKSRIVGRRAVSRRAAIRRSRCLRIVQGALFPELRRESAAVLSEMPFDGFAIGGLAVGESQERARRSRANSPRSFCRRTSRAISWVSARRSTSSKRSIAASTCSTASCRRNWRSAAPSFTSRGFLQMRRGVYKFSDETLDPACACPTCARYSRAYLHHLTKTSETLGWQLLGKHNIHFYHQLMRDIRESILAGRFADFYREKRAVSAGIRSRKSGASSEARRVRKSTLVRQLRGPYRARRLCQHPADFVGRDHAHAHAADGRGAQSLHRAIESRAAPSLLDASSGAARHLGRRPGRGGQRDGGDPMLRRAGGASVPSVPCALSASKMISIPSARPAA